MQIILKRNLRMAIIYDNIFFYDKRYKNTPSKNKQERTTDIRRILLYMAYLGETSVQLEKELRNFFQKYLKEFAQLSLIHRTHTIGDHFKYKDKHAHLERCNVVYKLKCSCGNSASCQGY